MLAYIKGTILRKKEKSAIIETDGLGYKIFIASQMADKIEVGQIAELWLYEKTTEQGRFLYGVQNFAELEFFEILLGVSGVGPKTALAILGVANLNDLKLSILNGDERLVASADGVGKKTAGRILLELKDKIDAIEPTSLDNAGNSNAQSSARQDEIDALVALGYNFNDARLAIMEVEKEQLDDSGRIKAALKYLGARGGARF